MTVSVQVWPIRERTSKKNLKVLENLVEIYIGSDSQLLFMSRQNKVAWLLRKSIPKGDLNPGSVLPHRLPQQL